MPLIFLGIFDIHFSCEVGAPSLPLALCDTGNNGPSRLHLTLPGKQACRVSIEEFFSFLPTPSKKKNAK